MSELGDRIKEVRRMTRLTQAKFAEQLGINRAHVSQIETGASNASEQLLKSICSAFHINETWLRTGAGEPKKPLTDQGGNLLIQPGGPLLPKQLLELVGGKLAELIKETFKRIEEDIAREGIYVSDEIKGIAVSEIVINSASKGEAIDPFIYETILKFMRHMSNTSQKIGHQ